MVATRRSVSTGSSNGDSNGSSNNKTISSSNGKTSNGHANGSANGKVSPAHQLGKKQGIKASNGHGSHNGTKEENVKEEYWDEMLPEKQKPDFFSTLAGLLPQPYVIDVRSLALFRILFGMLQLFDVYDRLKFGRYDLAFYTSTPDRSYNNPEAVYYDGFLSDLFLFQRGSTLDEIVFFAVYTLLTVCLTVGYQCKSRWLLPVLWLMYHALIGKNYAGSFGSDQLSGQLYTWMLFLPLSEVWSVDAMIRRLNGDPRDPRYSGNQVKSVACVGLTLQIVIMYLGCFFLRTFDTFSSISELHQSDWFWPDYPLVHFCTNGSGTYNTWFTKLVRETPPLNKFMTFCGFWIETIMPPLCFLLNQRYAHWFAIHIFLLHAGIGLILAIPHFYYLGMLIHCIWIPTSVWDSWVGPTDDERPSPDDEVARYKKTDGDDDDILKEEDVEEEKVVTGRSTFEGVKRAVTVFERTFSFLFQCVCFALLIITFLNERGWFPEWTEDATMWGWKYLYFESDWGMWSPGAARVSPFTVIVGYRFGETEEDVQDFNLYKFIRTGEEVPFEGFTDDLLANLTYQYPSTRWENALGDDWESYLVEGSSTDMSDQIGVALCNFVNEDMERLGRDPVDAIEIKVMLREISPPGSKTRYEEQKDGFEIQYDCFA